MTVRSLVAVLALMALPAAAGAQHAGGGPALVTTPAREASQFDFMVGQWDLVVRPQAKGLAAKIHGAPKLQGTWKAWRAFDGWGVQDELRIVDDSGNPIALSSAMRAWDPAAKRWNVMALDVYRSRTTTATAEWHAGRMTVSGRGTDQEGRAYLSRTTISDITPTSFRYQHDRSYDDGKTWDEGVLRIDAKRVAATASR